MKATVQIPVSTAGMRKPPSYAANPVARAVARAKAKAQAKRTAYAIAAVKDHMTRISIKAYNTDDGERADDLLAELALMLAIGTEIGVHTELADPGTRKMHAALRTVLSMSVNGRHWVASQARTLHEAAMMGAAAFERHIVFGLSIMEQAYVLSELVRRGEALMSDVCGSEIYNSKASA